MHSRKTRTARTAANALTVIAVGAWLATAALPGDARNRTLAVAGAASVATVVVNGRQNGRRGEAPLLPTPAPAAARPPVARAVAGRLPAGLQAAGRRQVQVAAVEDAIAEARAQAYAEGYVDGIARRAEATPN